MLKILLRSFIWLFLKKTPEVDDDFDDDESLANKKKQNGSMKI